MDIPHKLERIVCGACSCLRRLNLLLSSSRREISVRPQRIKHAVHYTARQKCHNISIESQHTITDWNNTTTQTTGFFTATWRNIYRCEEDETEVTVLFSCNQLFQVQLVTVFQQW